MCLKCGWGDVLEEWSGLEADQRFRWARQGIRGVMDWIAKHDHVTENQRRALANIRERSLNPPERRRRRVPE